MSESKKKIERRDVLKLGAAATVGFLAGDLRPAQAAVPPMPENVATPKAMPTRNLGRTGYRVGIFSLGGQAAIEKPDNADLAVPIVERALDLGVNYIDTSARYGGAEARWSERYIGEVMKRRRREAFLATKTHDRTREGSLRLLERSLELLGTDHVDLWQIHNLSNMARSTRSSRTGARSKRSPKRATRRSSGSSESRGTPIPTCSSRRSAAFRSTRSSWRSTPPTRTT